MPFTVESYDKSLHLYLVVRYLYLAKSNLFSEISRDCFEQLTACRQLKRWDFAELAKIEQERSLILSDFEDWETER